MFLSSNGVNQSASNFSTTLQRPLQLNDGIWCVALTQGNFWNTNPNITAAIGNNKINVTNSYTGAGTVWNTVTFPDGLYGINDIITYFDNQIDVIYGSPNTNTLLATVGYADTTSWTINGPWAIDMSVSTIASVLGFDNTQLTLTPAPSTTVTYVGNNEANITNGISNYLVHVNVLNAARSYLNGSPSDVIFSYTPAAPAGSLVSFTPTFPIFLDCSQAVVSAINVSITDQLNRSVILNRPGQTNVNPTSLQLLFVRKDDEINRSTSLKAYDEAQEAKQIRGAGRKR